MSEYMNELETASTMILGSKALHQLFHLVDEVKIDVAQAACGKRGHKAAQTRVRVKLARVAGLCREARRDIKPVGQAPDSPEE